MGAVVPFAANYNGSLFAEYIGPASAWASRMAHVHLADKMRHAAFWQWKIAKDENGRNSDAAKYASKLRSQAEDEWERQAVMQLFVAAPSIAALRWKEGIAKYRRHPEIAAALARDRAALATVIRRAQASAETRRRNRMRGKLDSVN